MSERMIDVDMTPNRSKRYLLPLLSEFIFMDKIVLDQLINTYVFDSNNEYKNCIFLLFNYDIKNPKFTKFENELSKMKGYIEHYDLKDNMVLYIIKFPKEYMSEYNHYKNGKYSSFDKDAQELILNFLLFQGVSDNFLSKMEMIFNKDPYLKKKIEKDLGVILEHDAELDDAYDQKKETINIERYINTYI